MWSIVWAVTIFVTTGNAAYFTMSEVELDIPGNRSILLPNNTAIATMYALNDHPNPNKIDHVWYSLQKLQERHYLEIYHGTGDIMFSTAFLNETAKNISEVRTSVFASDSLRQDKTTFQVNILPADVVDCDLITADLCFWKSVRYRVFENRKPSLIGSLSSAYLVEMCPGYKINYTLINGSSHFSLIPPTDLNKTWGLKTTRSLDRDVSRNNTITRSFGIGQVVNITVGCNLVNPKGTKRNVTKTLSVTVLDEDDNVPFTRNNSIVRITVEKASIIKNHSLLSGVQNSQALMFYDRDSKGVNVYRTKLTGNGTSFLRQECKEGEDDRHGEHQTVFKCDLIVTKSLKEYNTTYTVVLLVNDTTLLPGYGKSIIEQPIEIKVVLKKDKELHQPKPAENTILYPSTHFEISRTAAPFVRITEPDPKLKRWNPTNFRIKKRFNDPNRVVAITNRTGIIYLDSNNLTKIKDPIKLIVEWKRNNTKESENITISIIESNSCLGKTSDINDWVHCAEKENAASCEKECGLATGGPVNNLAKDFYNKQSRCFWVTSKLGNYSTCSPGPPHCPDQHCDELEQLYPLICPQDCAERMSLSTPKNEETGYGIGRASGVCTCDINAECFCETRLPKKKHKTTTTTITPLQQHESNLTKSSPHIGKHPSSEIQPCGTSCMLGIASGVVSLLGFVAVIVVYWRHDRAQKGVRGKLSQDAQDLQAPLSDYVDRSILQDSLQLNFDMITALNQEHKIGPDPRWEFPRGQLIIEQTLGEGEFGRVLRAKAKDIAGQVGHTTVAVKTLKEDARGGELADLLSEYELLKDVSHPNVIKLLGACTSPGGPVYLIIEFAQYGSLRSYLRRSRHLKPETRHPRILSLDENDPSLNYDHPNATVEKILPKDILSFAWQISKGMSYLAEIKLVHRDLAARNVLLATGKVCKISDFGLTRDVYEDNAYFKRSKGRVPVKWMAPESLSDHVYTSKSDVWSFGILVWELVTLGATPYPGVLVQNLFNFLRQGYRMERPENCSVTLYKTMRNCWNLDPNERPSFQALTDKFEKMLTDGVDYLDLSTNAIHNRSYFCANINSDKEENIENSNNNSPVAPSVNYLDKLQQYVKCGESDKLLNDNSQVEYNNITNVALTTNLSTQGYESPNKLPNTTERSVTPTNECPQYYTSMAKQQN
nr:proto-oncogene tyrosine-protein kinase receptor Ret isoform X1 [Onthophagus taurus]XP_022910572.1 proto-oncogene tyrosine-protein kinase receptor Ret isoform X2 [Onthophagus taurus]